MGHGCVQVPGCVVRKSPVSTGNHVNAFDFNKASVMNHARNRQGAWGYYVFLKLNCMHIESQKLEYQIQNEKH